VDALKLSTTDWRHSTLELLAVQINSRRREVCTGATCGCSSLADFLSPCVLVALIPRTEVAGPGKQLPQTEE
jgi:hypothetical protein